MADRPNPLLVDALSRAAAAGTPVPLHGTRTTPGLFPTTTAGKQAGQRACEDGYFRPTSPEAEAAAATGTLLTRPRVAASELCRITEKGLAYLLHEINPRPVLEAFVRTLEERRAQAADLLAAARQMQASLDSIGENVERVLHQYAPGPPAPGDLKALFKGYHESPEPTLDVRIRDYLAQWCTTGPAVDCPLPDLYHRLAKGVPGLTIGRFHDVLREMQASERIYLHPWPGPLYELPEPAYALVVGHLVAYYASLRSEG